MRALIIGVAGVLGVLCLSNPAMAQNRNTITIHLDNKADHSIGLHDVSARPQAKNWSWSPETVKPGGTGIFSCIGKITKASHLV